jgi:hypothetical protein
MKNLEKKSLRKNETLNLKKQKIKVKKVLSKTKIVKIVKKKNV